MKTRFALLVGSACLLFTLACSDSTSLKRATPTASPLVITPGGSLDQNILQILTLFPQGLETAATTRWGNVKSKYAAGLLDPAQMVVAKQMAFDLSAWVNMKAPNMDTPPNGETRVSAATRAIQYMLLYIYSGPGTTVPDYNPAADAIVGLVTPGAPATIVTPSFHAGVQFEAGSVAENTVIVISQNLLTAYPKNCSGPLKTLLCQYPQFYNFDQFPHKKLLKGAKFSVCHVNNSDSPRYPLPRADHEQFRLAHAKPDNSADYTPGSTIRDGPGESIEILPLISQTFTVCPPQTVTYASAAGMSDGLFSRVARGIMSALTPKSAYAIDQGGGGVSFFFSPFNDVDPPSTPDRAVQTFTVTPVCGPVDCLAHPGTSLTLNYTISNIGTASTDDGVLPGTGGTINLVQPAIEGPPVTIQIGGFGFGQLVPGQTLSFSQVVVIPNTVPAGDYNVVITAGGGSFPDNPADLANNTRSVPLNVSVDLSGLITGATSDFAIAYHGNGLAPMAEGQVTFSALFTDEFLSAETSAPRIAIDRRSVLADNVSVRNSFRDIQRARATLDYASQQWGQNLNISPGHGILLAYRAFADVLLAENWCSGVPTSVLSGTGTVTYGTQQTTTQLLQSAIAKFDSAIAIATVLGESGTTDLITARIGKARALLDLNDVAGAAAITATVPTAFSLGMGPSATENNGIFEFQNVEHLWTVSDNEGANGLFYRSDEDSRIDFESVGTGPDGVTPVFAQLRYPNAGAGTALAQGVEARLIEAEASLRTGDLANFTVKINTVRVFYGLTPITIPETGAAARGILFTERAYSLWLTSHRLGDLRRLVRQYDLGQSFVFPTGEYPKGGVYGSDVNFPIPVDATFNPAGLACFDRNP